MLNDFESWRSQVAVEKSFLDDVLLSDDPKLLYSCLYYKYVTETRKANGQLYPPDTSVEIDFGSAIRIAGPHTCRGPLFNSRPTQGSAI